MTQLVQQQVVIHQLKKRAYSLAIPFTLSLSKGELWQHVPFMVRQAHHERFAELRGYA